MHEMLSIMTVRRLRIIIISVAERQRSLVQFCEVAGL
jgi:hypothetical protein